MKKLLNSGIMALTVLASSQAFANNFYIGATAGQTNYNNASGMDKPTAYEVFGGYQLHKNYAFEVSYHDFGDTSGNFTGYKTLITNLNPLTTQNFAYDINRSLEGSSISAALKLIIPSTDRLDFYAKLGFHYWDITTKTEGFDASRQPSNFREKDSDSDTELMYGIGLDFEVVRNFNLGLRYTAFQVDSDEMSVYGLSANYKFNFK